jgi:xylan 1,4-beta-xylosidase
MNVKAILIFIFLVTCASLFAEWQSDNGDGTFKNPPLYADYPDPSIIRVGNDFYLASSTFVNSPGLVILHSQDLVNWEIASHCISSLPTGGAYDMIGGVKYANGCFAPSLAYNNGTFYVAVDLNGDGGTRIYHATNPAGPWSYNQLSTGYFDPCLFFDNGTPYIIWGGAWENSIKIIQLNSSLNGTTGSQSTILSYNNIEGSHLVKRGSYYYLFNAVPANSLVCSRATTIKGPYSGTTTLARAGSGGHQGGIVDLPDGSYWGYLHQDDGAPGRMTRICPITWSNDWPLFGRSGYTGTVESSYTKPIANKPIMVPAASDEFNSSTLGLQWMWNHNPDNSKWSFTGSALRLKATTGSDFWHARNSLIQKGQGQTSSGSIRIDCTAMQSGDIMGLGILGDPRGYIAVTTSPKRIIMSEEDSVKATVNNVSANILYFRVEMNFSNKQAKFFWRDDSTTTWQSLGTTITMGFDWQNGTFQGEQYAILCFNTGSSSGYMDVDWFRLDDKAGPGGDATPDPTAVPTAVPTIGPTPGPTGVVNGSISIACGSSSDVGSFQPDQYFTGGSTFNNTNTIDVSLLGSNPPPAALFNNERYGAMSYTIPGFTSGSSYNVTLYFAETYLTASGGRLFNVSINGAAMLSNFDIYASAGAQNKAVAKSFTTTADGSGQIAIQFTSITENPKINGISIDPGSNNGTKGDVNGSGTVDIVDALLIAQYYVGLNPSGFIAENADVNCSGTIDIVDALLVAQYYVGLMTAFPC